MNLFNIFVLKTKVIISDKVKFLSFRAKSRNRIEKKGFDFAQPDNDFIIFDFNFAQSDNNFVIFDFNFAQTDRNFD